jgi:aspartyl-tRNA(Asn)/glutamyl-tRNA(Gln) amidotransferase subunit C
MEEAEFNKLCKLSRISCTEEEKKNFLKSLGDILSYVEQLQEIDTEGVPPCYTVHEALENVMREDIPEEPLSRDLFLANAPAHVGGMIRVPPVLKQ